MNDQGSDELSQFIGRIFSLSDDVRYVAVYEHGNLTKTSRAGTSNASDSESDRYEELLVNPTLLKLAGQRGDIDCGGLSYLLIRYGNFYQFVQPIADGHISVCLDEASDAIEMARRIRLLVSRRSF